MNDTRAQRKENGLHERKGSRGKATQQGYEVQRGGRCSGGQTCGQRGRRALGHGWQRTSDGGQRGEEAVYIWDKHQRLEKSRGEGGVWGEVGGCATIGQRKSCAAHFATRDLALIPSPTPIALFSRPLLHRVAVEKAISCDSIFSPGLNARGQPPIWTTATPSPPALGTIVDHNAGSVLSAASGAPVLGRVLIH